MWDKYNLAAIADLCYHPQSRKRTFSLQMSRSALLFSSGIRTTLFRNIALADELGSGVKKLFKYVLRYSGKEPQLFDGDVFRTIVPLDDNYSYDAHLGEAKVKTPNKTSKPQKEKDRALIEVLIVDHVKTNPQVTQKEIIDASGKSKRTIQEGFASLQEKGVLVREGARMNGVWIVKENNK